MAARRRAGIRSGGVALVCATSGALGLPLVADAAPAPVAAGVTAAAPVGPWPAAARALPDPARWSDSRLAAQLVFACVDSRRTATAQRYAAAGIGGVALLGNRPPADLAARLRALKAAGPRDVHVLVASDEEGGAVQRLAPLLGRLPSAETMGRWTTRDVNARAYSYGVKLKRLGVDVDLAPVADLAVPGKYMAVTHRAFAATPAAVGKDVVAWSSGMRRAGVPSVVKHWPGHGSATNSHTGIAVVPPRSVLEGRDMVPFRTAVANGVTAVMVGHLQSSGLTEPNTPASESRTALTVLRADVGPRTLVVTDALDMAAASGALGLSTASAAVRALRSGADWAMVCSDPEPVVAGVLRNLRSGTLPRARAVEAARRIVAFKASASLVP